MHFDFIKMCLKKRVPPKWIEGEEYFLFNKMHVISIYKKKVKCLIVEGMYRHTNYEYT